MSVEQSGLDFGRVPKGEELREECEGYYHEDSPRLPHKGRARLAPARSSHFLLLLIALLLFLVVVVAANYHFSMQVLRAVERRAAGAEEGKLLARLEELEGSQRKILTKLGEVSIKLGNLDGSTVNVVEGDAASSREGREGLEQFKEELESLSKQLTVIKYDIATANKNIEAESAESLTQLTEIKELVLKNTEISEKAAQRPAALPAQSDERSFEADFLTDTDPPQQKFTAASEVYVGSDYVFSIPKKLWMFKRERHGNYLQELCYQNNAYFARSSNYEVVYVEMGNYRQFLSPKGGDKVFKFLELLRKRVESNDPSNLKYHLESISRKFILYNILHENGGVVTSGEFALTEDLSWIEKIMSNPYPNRGNRGIKPQVVGFYSLDYSLEKTKENLKPFPGLEETDKYVTLFPALEDYFIAAEKGSLFLGRLVEEIRKVLRRPEQFRREKGHYKLINLKGEDIYYEYFLAAVQVVLQEKQKAIDASKIDGYRHFAIDYYGLQLINCYYAPYKLKAFWGNGQSHKAFQSLSQYPRAELEANLGPMRYLARITPAEEMNGYLEDTKNGKRPPLLLGSFLQQLFFPQGSQPFVRKNPEVPFVNTSSAPWSALPKVIWVFWDKGLANAGVNNQICVQNLRRMAGLSGFNVTEVNMSNINSFLPAETIGRIEGALAKAKLKTYPQSKGDLFRLALLAKYGGIYMDASYIALESFEWLVNIGKYPSEYIFNRFGGLPKAFMMWHPHYGAPLEWSVSKEHGVKSQWHLAYENNFIAAERGSELVSEWFQLLLSLYVRSYGEVEQVFQECQMYSNKWSTSNWHYLIPMDAVKCVVGRREVALAKQGNHSYASASHYYGLWSMSGYLGQQKLRSNTNFESPGSEDNLFVYRYSQEYVEGLIGRVRHLAKFYSQHNKELGMLVGKHIDGNFSGEAHPQSIFMRHMWQPSFRIQEVNFQPTLRTP